MILDGFSMLLKEQEPKYTPKYNLKKITWTQETGQKGPYEKAIEQDNQDFRALINDLEAHAGKLQRNEYFIWKLPTENKIMRRPTENNNGVLI